MFLLFFLSSSFFLSAGGSCVDSQSSSAFCSRHRNNRSIADSLLCLRSTYFCCKNIFISERILIVWMSHFSFSLFFLCCCRARSRLARLSFCILHTFLQLFFYFIFYDDGAFKYMDVALDLNKRQWRDKQQQASHRCLLDVEMDGV